MDPKPCLSLTKLNQDLLAANNRNTTWQPLLVAQSWEKNTGETGNSSKAPSGEQDWRDGCENRETLSAYYKNFSARVPFGKLFYLPKH